MSRTRTAGITIPLVLAARKEVRGVDLSLGAAIAVLALLIAPCSLALARSQGNRASYLSTAINGFVHDVWRSSDGLPQNSVQAILQTRDGYLWLGTQEGLVRFDGVAFTVFNRQNTAGLRLNDIRALAEDRSGALWIGTFGGGLSRLKDGKFKSYSAPESLSNNFVSFLYPDREGSLWIGTQGGIDRWKDGKFSSYTVRDGLADNFVFSICEDREGKLWVGTNGGLSRLTDGRFATYKMPGSRRIPAESIYEDHSGNLWIGTDRELFRLRDGNWTAFTEKDGVPRGPVTFISEDRDRNLWIGTSGAGVLRLRDGRFASFSTRDGLSNSSVLSIYEDRERSIWIGTNGGGLNRLRRGAFKTYDEAAGLSSGSVMSIYQSRDASLWIGTDGGGLDHLKDGKVTVYRSHDGLSNETIRSIYEDREGNLWLGTDGGGVNQFRNGTFRVYSTRDGLSNDSVRSVYGDHDGNIWIGTYGGGLNRLRNGKFRTYTTRDGLPSNTVWVTYEDRRNNLWVGTNGGLAEFKDGRFRKLEVTDASNAMGAPSAVLSIYEDQQGVLWIGTLSGGLKRRKDGKFTTYTIADGMFDDLIYTILEDDRRYLWMSSNKGIFRVSKQELEDFATGKIKAVTSVAYGLADGMKNAECNGGSEPSGWKTNEGKLLFANLSGLIEVDPDHIETNPLPPPVVIQHALINQKSYDPRMPAEVPPGKGELELNYTAMSFLAPQRMTFKYRLEGFDSQWVEAGTRRTAYYTNIPPGSYRFRVIASNNDGIWNEVGAAMNLKLRAHFYQTYVFYGICTLLLGLGVYVFHRVRVASLKARELKLLSLVDQRTQELQQDIAQRKQAEAALRESQEYFHTFMNNSPAVATLKDEQGRYIYVNRTFESLFCSHLGNYNGRTAFDWLPQEIATQISENNALVLSKGTAAEFIEVIPTTDGTPHEWLSVRFPVSDAHGRRMVGAVSIDITGRRRAERRLEQRTRELQKEVKAREEARAKLAEAQQRLMEMSRLSGMAEVATGVLHNVGNVLNSVNVSATIAANKARELSVENLIKLSRMLEEHSGDLPEFLSQDARGQRVLPYLAKLGAHLQQERQTMLRELESLADHVGHIKAIVATQQNYAKVSGLTEIVSLPELLEDAIRIVEPGFERHKIHLERDYEQVPPVAVDKHTVLQIVLNLLRNAKQAIKIGDNPDRRVRVCLHRDGEDHIRISVEDTGVGLPPENLTKIFSHGFTTRRDGHGFGLHSGANAARLLSGALLAKSDGPGLGATFTLELPVSTREVTKRIQPV